MSELAEGKEERALVKATIAMAKDLGLKVIAEGVENAQQLEYIQENQCDFAQGYYFSKAVTEPELETLLIEQSMA